MLRRASVFFVSSQRIVAKSLTRNIGVTSVCAANAQATDPIQKLFIDKIRAYSEKSKSSGGKLVDASPETEKSLHDELEKLARQYGAKGVDFTKFPTFNFADPDLEPVGIHADIKPQAVGAEHEELLKEDDDKPYWEA